MEFEEWAKQYRQLGYPESSLRARWDEINPGALSLLGRGLASGLTQMAESVGSGLQFLGANELGKSVQEYWANVGEQYQPPPSIQGSIIDSPDLMAKPEWWAYNLSQMAPFTASMFVPGIAAAKGAQAIGAAAKGVGLASRIGAASRGIGTAVGAGTGGFFEAMPEYQQSLEDGMDPTEARLRAGATGLAIGALNTIPLSRAFGPGGLAKRMLTTGVSEAATEWAEEPTTAAIYGRDIGEAAYQGANVIPPAFVMGMLGAGGTPKGVRRPAVSLPDDSPLLRETLNLPGREKMRARLVDEIVSRGTPKEQPTAYVFGGGGAAGKGTMREALTEMGAIDRDAALIDPDEVKAKIPEYQAIAGIGDPRAAIVTHEESSLISSEALARAIDERKDVVIDKTLGNPEKAVRLLQSLRDAGYKTELIGVTVDPGEALRRAMKRGERTSRYVDTDALVKAHRGFSSGFEVYASMVDSAALYDTSTSEPTKIAEAANGRLEVLNNERYNRFKKVSGEAANEVQPAGRPPAGQNAGAGYPEGYQAPGQAVEGQAPGAFSYKGLTDNAGKEYMTLYRAQNGEMLTGRYFSEDIDVAARYTDNQGFGGDSIIEVRVPKSSLDRVLTLHGNDKKELLDELPSNVANDVAERFDSGEYAYNFEALHDDRVKKALNKKYDWVEYRDNYPNNAITKAYLGDISDLDNFVVGRVDTGAIDTGARAQIPAERERVMKELDNYEVLSDGEWMSAAEWYGGGLNEEDFSDAVMMINEGVKPSMSDGFRRTGQFKEVSNEAANEGQTAGQAPAGQDTGVGGQEGYQAPRQAYEGQASGAIPDARLTDLRSLRSETRDYRWKLDARNPATFEVTEERAGARMTVNEVADGLADFEVRDGLASVSGVIDSKSETAIINAPVIDGTSRRAGEELTILSAAIDGLYKRGIKRFEVPVERIYDGSMMPLQYLENTGVISILGVKTAGGKRYQVAEIKSDPERMSKEIADVVKMVARSKVSTPGDVFSIPVTEQADISKYERLLTTAPRYWAPDVPANGAQARALGSALADLEAAGMPPSWIESLDAIAVGAFSNKDVNAHYVPKMRRIAVGKIQLDSAMVSQEAAKSIRSYLAHEIAHAVDVDQQGNALSMSSELFDIAPGAIRQTATHTEIDPTGVGPVMLEAIQYRANNDDTISRFLDYPLASLSDVVSVDKQDSPANNIKVELFAQLMSLYYTAPGAMQKALPLGYELIQEVSNAETANQAAGQSRSAIQAALRSANTVGGLSGPQLAAAPAKGAILRSVDPGVRDGKAGERSAAREDVNVGYFDTESRRAGNINLDKMGRLTPEAEQVLRDTWDMFKTPINKARRGVIPWEQTEAMAEALGMNPKDLAKRAAGEAFNAEKLEAARKIIEESALAVAEQSRKAEETGNPEDIIKAYEMMLQHADLQAPFSGAVSEAGRALNILRKMSDQARAARDIVESDASIEQKVAMMAGLNDPGQVSKFSRDAAKVRASDVLLEVWINALLSGPQTHVVNIMSNALVDMFSLGENAVAAALGAFRKGEKVTLRETMARAVGMIRGGLEGARLAKDAFITEETTGQNKVEARRYQTIVPETFGVDPNTPQGRAITKIGRTVRIPGRALGAMDEYFKSVARRSSLAGLAVRKAYAEGLSGDAWAERVKELTNNPTKEMEEKSAQEAEYMTFTNRLGPFGRALQRMAVEVPALRIIIPFIRTPINIVKFAAHRSPLMLASGNWWRSLRTSTGAERDVMLARMLTGTALMTAVAALTAAGKITGGGPDDPRERELLRRTGWQPYSVKDGDQWVAYSRLEPLGMLFGIAADMQEIASDDDVENVASMLVASMAKNIASKTWLRGVSEAILALSDPDRYGDRWWINLMGTAVPTAVAQVARVQDPILRDARTVVDKLLSRIPGQTEKVMPRRDTRGEVIKLEGGIGPDILSPIYASKEKSDPVAEELLRIGQTIGKPSRRVAGVELSPDEYDAYQQAAGKMIQDALERIITSKRYQKLPDEAKKAVLERIILKYRQAARWQLLKQRPEILGRRYGT